MTQQGPPESLARELRELVVLAWPIAVAQLGLIAMGLVDTAILGRVSATELAGAAIGRSLGFGAITLAMGVATGLEPLAAQAVGAGEPERAWEGLRTTVKAVVLLSGPLLAAAYALTYTLAPLGTDPAIIARAREYLLGQAPGLALAVVFLAGKTFLQAHGITRPALVASVVANVTNFFVCNLLVRGDDALAAVGLAPRGLPRLGSLGAGIAFSLADCVLAAVVLPAVWRCRPREAAAGGARRGVPFATVFRLGLPVGLQMLAEYGVFSFATVLVGRFGGAAVSAHQIALGLSSFTYMGALGIGGATAVRVGHAVGAGVSVRRRGFVGISVGAAFMLVGAAAFALAPFVLVRLFTTQGDVVTLGAELLAIAALFQLFDGVQTVAGGALRGAGDVRFTFVANLLAHWGLGLPLALTLGFALGRGVTGIWWGLTAGLVVVACTLATRFAWMSRRIVARVA